MKRLIVILAIILALLLFLLAGLTIRQSRQEAAAYVPRTDPQTDPPPSTEAPTTQPATVPVIATEPVTEPEPTETEPTRPPFEVRCMEDTDPANWNVDWDVIVGDEFVEDYVREEEIFFQDEAYMALPGVSSFRGGNYRNDAGYGTAQISDGRIHQLWNKPVGALSSPEWGGCGWTGQPLVIQWDEETKAIMNLYPEKREKEGLTEVIYAKMDGYVHFFDIEDGSYTRDPLYVGMTFKGSGAIDPRGYPLLYLGAGLQSGSKTQSIFIISLIDGSILYELSGYESKSNRWWFAFDGAPLVDAETDTLVWGGESGVLYTIKLNTQYDKSAGTISVEPDPAVKSRYAHDYQRSGRYAGYEASVTGVENYLFVGDNGGIMQCIDINTMQIVWAQDLKDDINATALFDWGNDGNGYLYVATSTDYTNRNFPLYKLDAQTGRVLWSHDMECVNVPDVPGGTLSSPMMGRAGSDIENMVLFSVGRSPSAWVGQMVALDKDTGELLWQFETSNYMWSSPVALYTEEGKSYIFQADASGNCYLLEGTTGEVVDRVQLGCTVEASPIAFGNRVVLGSRTGMYLFEIK